MTCRQHPWIRDMQPGQTLSSSSRGSHYAMVGFTVTRWNAVCRHWQRWHRNQHWRRPCVWPCVPHSNHLALLVRNHFHDQKRYCGVFRIPTLLLSGTPTTTTTGPNDGLKQDLLLAMSVPREPQVSLPATTSKSSHKVLWWRCYRAG